MKKVVVFILFFNPNFSMFKTASPEMIPKHALVKGPIEILGKQKFGPLYLVLLRKGKREEAIRLVMPLSYEGFIESFYHGPLREMEVSISEALEVLKTSEMFSQPESLFEILLPIRPEKHWAESKERQYGALFYAYCKVENAFFYQMGALLRLKAAHEAGKYCVFTHNRNFERKEETVTFPARDIPLR